MGDIVSQLEEIEASSDRKRRCEDNEDLEQYKRVKSSIHDSAKEFFCPLTHKLMVEPMIAEDNHLYEREAIIDYFKKNADITSPVTKNTIGTTLSPAPSTVRNTIEHLLKSGAIDDEFANEYKKQKLVLETRKSAEEGNYPAMHLLGEWYLHGSNGIPKDEEQAKKWKEKVGRYVIDQFKRAKQGDALAMYYYGMINYKGQLGLKRERKISYEYIKLSADLGEARAMAWLGERLMYPSEGIEKNLLKGISLTSVAASQGSQLACYNLGMLYMKGDHGMPRDKINAINWFRKVVDGRCKTRDLNKKCIMKAREWLKKLGEE